MQAPKRDTDSGRTVVSRGSENNEEVLRSDRPLRNAAPASFEVRRSYKRGAWFAGVLLLISLIGILLWQANHRSAGSSGSPSPMTVAVLPFQNMNSEKEVDFLRLALPDEIATALSYVHSLSIRPFATTSKYVGPTLDLQQAGREMRPL
jgi:hypothetical protein